MLKKIGHIILSFILLVSTVGMTVNMHFCKHKLYDIGIFTQAMNCCVDTKHDHGDGEHKHQKSHASHDCNTKDHNPNDCQDETITIAPVDHFVVSSTNFSFNQEVTNTLFAAYFIVIDAFNLSEVTISDKIPKFEISPPRIQVVLSKLQTYLI